MPLLPEPIVPVKLKVTQVTLITPDDNHLSCQVHPDLQAAFLEGFFGVEVENNTVIRIWPEEDPTHGS